MSPSDTRSDVNSKDNKRLLLSEYKSLVKQQRKKSNEKEKTEVIISVIINKISRITKDHKKIKKMEEELKNDYEFLSKLEMELKEIANRMQELENILNIKAQPINSDDLNKRQGAGWLRSYGIDQLYDEQRKLGILSGFGV